MIVHINEVQKEKEIEHTDIDLGREWYGEIRLLTQFGPSKDATDPSDPEAATVPQSSVEALRRSNKKWKHLYD